MKNENKEKDYFFVSYFLNCNNPLLKYLEKSFFCARSFFSKDMAKAWSYTLQ